MKLIFASSLFVSALLATVQAYSIQQPRQQTAVTSTNLATGQDRRALLQTAMSGFAAVVAAGTMGPSAALASGGATAGKYT